MRVITPHEMAEIDEAAIEREKIPGLTLMERAGERVTAAANGMLAESGGRRAAIWCGKGNNAGDGFVAARLLSGLGLDITVLMLAPADELANDAHANFERLQGLPVSIKRIKDEAGIDDFVNAAGPFDLVVDAIFGTGFTGRAQGVFGRAISVINDAGCPVLAVDIPSGVSGVTGVVSGPAVKATKTVTFAALKVGLVQFPGAALAGETEVVDIGIPGRLVGSIPKSNIHLIDEELAESLLPERAPDVHKRQCGHVLVVGGSPGMTGAAALAAQAALRAGSGLVTLAVPRGVHSILEIKLTEVMTRPLPETEKGNLSLKAAGEIADIIKRFDVLALGPGASTENETSDFIRELVETTEIPLVLDADGINAMVGHTGKLKERRGPLVLTPHPGEMARLLESDTSTIQGDRIKAAREAAILLDAVVVLKGAGTLVAEPGGCVRVNTSGNPGMATAGMGDVLTGCIASFIGQGLNAFDAASAGVFFHGHAADLAARMDSMIGMLAGDVIRRLPLAMRKA